MNPSSAAVLDESAPIADPNMQRRRRMGRIIATIGFVCFLPAILVAILVPSLRLPGALATLGFWIVWKIGRTIMKLNSPE